MTSVPRIRLPLALGSLLGWAFLEYGYPWAKGLGLPMAEVVVLALGGFTLVLAHAAWGFSHLPQGWRRVIILAGLALPLPSLLLGVQDFWRGFHDGWYGRYAPPTSAPREALQHLLVSAALLGFFLLIARHRDEAAQQKVEAERERQRAEALKDQALRAKLAPHFIFNTLNTLKAQIAADPAAAEATTDRLAALFRQVVQVADQPTIPLKQELAFVEAYLGIEQARLGDRLTVVLDIPEDLEDLPVPPLSLQVLVENAVKHGVAPREAGGQIRIRAVDRRPEGLWLEVTDPGDGSVLTPSGTGTALSTLRQRLARPEDLSLEPTSQGFRASLFWNPQTRNLA